MGVRTARRVCSMDSMVGDWSVGGFVLRKQRDGREVVARVDLCIGVYCRGMG
jgi:hypothetical protein